jgi:hypothetical protein
MPTRVPSQVERSAPVGETLTGPRGHWMWHVKRGAFGKNQLSEPLRTLVSALQFMLSTDSPRFHPHLLRLRLQSPRAHWGS